MRNELSSHARWEQLFEAILFCQILNYGRENHLIHVKLTIQLYQQLMEPKSLAKLIDKDLLRKNIKEYIDSTPVVYERSIQLIAVRTLLMSIDGNSIII